MSARQLNRLAKAKGLDPLLGGSLNVDSDESDVPEDSEEEGGNFASGVVVSASVGVLCTAVAVVACVLSWATYPCAWYEEIRCTGALTSPCE